MKHVPTSVLRRWAHRFDAMPSWAFMIPTIRDVRYAVENELLARDLEKIAEEHGAHPAPFVTGWN